MTVMTQISGHDNWKYKPRRVHLSTGKSEEISIA